MSPTRPRTSLVSCHEAGLFVHLWYICVTASSGTVTINADGTVQILAEEAFPLDMLDLQVHMHITWLSHDQILAVSNVCPIILQEARQGLEKCKQKRSSASSNAERAEADIGIELYEALIKALEWLAASIYTV